MKKMGDFRPVAGGMAVVALALVMSAAPATAQSGEDCRCVDRDGNRIENCSCFRTPRIEGLIRSLGFSDARPRLGISVDVRQSARRDAQGALVTDVLDEGPADEAGLEPGDLITSIDGRSLLDPLAADVEDDFDLDESVPVQRLLALASELEPGEEVEVGYLRDGESRTATLEAEDLSDSWGAGAVMAPAWDAERFRERMRALTEDARAMQLRAEEMEERMRGERQRSLELGERGRVRFFSGGDAPNVIIERLGRAVDGLHLVELNPELGAYFGAEEGVLVADVDEESALGLEPGDVVLGIGDRPVQTPGRMRRILQSYAPDEDITLRVRRDGREITVTGRLGG